MLKDSQHRHLATDPTQSFIVQAPAGSGKTEILTQRFLRLLSQVHQPEQIIALTFTRKAASEMRERILAALRQAKDGALANSPHQQQTFAYAQAALTQDQHRGWQLLEQPNRLSIMTIDSLCQRLSQAIPLHEKQLPYAEITERPYAYYQQAARACINHALTDTSLQDALQSLLIHLDNRQDQLVELFSQLLATRDQWLDTLYEAKALHQTEFEQALLYLEQQALKRLRLSINRFEQESLCTLSREMALVENNPQSPRYPLRNWQQFKQLDRPTAKSLASLLLTQEPKLRRSFDHHVGLRKGICEEEYYQYLKKSSQTLLQQLGENLDFLPALLRASELPEPHYDKEQWTVLQALFTLLPFLAAHLHLTFKEANRSDFATLTQQALQALGDEQYPTDLTLYLDHQIHHLLVDEFQDTSLQQANLLEKLVQEWQAGDGRTLFVVGDPMQSIYRFRQAEVGLFLKAKQQGIGPVTLIPLELSSNFRSSPTLVAWINHHFKMIFPQQDDIASGAISFHSATAVLDNKPESCVQAWQYSNKQEEAQAIVNLVQNELKQHPHDEIALLVRSRNQLSAIIPLLRAQQISFQGVEVEKLSDLPHLRDIWVLTQALLYPANRLVWLSLLRSPWFGLSLADLEVLANFSPKQGIFSALNHLSQLPKLSTDGLLRLQYCQQVMSQAFAQRQQQSLVTWVHDTAKQLHVHAILDLQQQADLEQFWPLLDHHSQDGQLADYALFVKEFEQLYSQRVIPSRLKIMTIHKSKGLEFDCVILPGLGNKSFVHDKPLLRWLKLPSEEQDHLLISPLQGAYQKESLLYDYLGKVSAEKEHYELQRLFYVATTRAKKRLYLFDNKEQENKNSFRAFVHQQPFISGAAGNQQESKVKQQSILLSRLPSEYYQTGPVTDFLVTNQLILNDISSHARSIGIIAHELLQWMGNYHPSDIKQLPWSLVSNRLRSIGLNQQQQQTAFNLLHQQIALLMADSIGQWLFQAHPEEKNEYELLTHYAGQMHIHIIDRTFVAEGVRWVIDYKTGNKAELMQPEHRKQVEIYAQLLQSLSPESIHCGLYYLASNTWIHWLR